MSEQSEFCEQQAKWRFLVEASYARFACADHVSRTRRLIELDYGDVRFMVRAAKRTEGP